MAARKQAKTSIHTHMYNAVSLVWGLLSLVPTTEAIDSVWAAIGNYKFHVAITKISYQIFHSKYS